MKIYVLSRKRKTWEVFNSVKDVSIFFLGKKTSEYVVFKSWDENHEYYQLLELPTDVFEIKDLLEGK